MSDLKYLIDVAAARQPADVVLRGGKLVNVLSNEIYEVDIAVAGGRVAGVGRYEGIEIVDLKGAYVCPGFIDAHVHIESSMLSVPQFAKLSATCGTVAVITDPHEIANVMGIEGIRYMLTSSKSAPVRVYVMLSSCVPASALESAGAELLAEDLSALLPNPWVLGLAEMMNYPGVVAGDQEVLDKLEMAKQQIVDGHCPGLGGHELQAYACTGIASDHECTTADEAREKLRSGQFIMIREGSQARNLDALLPVVTPATIDRFMFVTDDKDVEDLMSEGQIDHIIRRAIASGMDPVAAIRLATINPARYFGLRDLGAVAPGYDASFVVLSDLNECRVSRVYKSGEVVAIDGEFVGTEPATHKASVLRSSMNVHHIEPGQLTVHSADSTEQSVHVIELSEGQLVTGRSVETLPVADGAVQADPELDVAKIAVIERHQASGRVGLAFIRGFGLRAGAIASTVAHDAHNIVVTGTNDADMYTAAVHLVQIRGGLCAVKDRQVLAEMPLPVAGLMSDAPAAEACAQLQTLHKKTAEHLGCTLRKPFMALSFMSLSVIGALKVTDHGLIDVEQFKPIDLLAQK